MTDSKCPACGSEINNVASSAPFVGLLRILEKAAAHVKDDPELRERIREQLEGPFAELMKREERALNALHNANEMFLLYIGRSGLPSSEEIAKAALALQGKSELLIKLSQTIESRFNKGQD